MEDQALLAEALAAALEDRHGMVVSAVRGSADVVAGDLDGVDADVVVMAWRLLRADGPTVVRATKSSLPGAPVVVMTTDPDEHLLMEVVTAGCEGLVSKAEGVTDLVRGIQAVLRGKTAYAVAAGAASTTPPPVRLTRRQHDVLRCLGDGLSTHEIAEQLGLSWHTVRTHVRNVMRKFGTRSRVGAVAAARRLGMLPYDPGD